MMEIRTGSAFQQVSDSKGRRSARLLAVLASCASPIALMAQDLPTGGNVVAGQAQITSPSTNQMTINQSTNNAVINWDSFNVGSGAHVQFNQPSTSSATLNRVNGSTGSEIHGQITANGSVFVVNPNGIFIGADGNIQTGGGFVASTLDISNDGFQNGRLRFEGNGQSAKVENAGTITVGRGGYAALLGGHVDNSGTISVPMGRVAFGSGERITLDLSGDGFLQVAVPTDAISEEGQALIEHSGSVAAEGGIIEMKAATAREAVRQAVNLSGVAEATSVQQRGGTIFLGGGAGGQVQVTGRVSARAEVVTAVETSIRPQARGGDITVTGVDIALSGAEIDASGADGGGLIRIGGDFAGAGDLQRAEAVEVDAATTISSDALGTGDGGRIAVWSDLRTEFAGRNSARGGDAGGDGGFVEISSAQVLEYTGRTTTTAAMGETGTLLLDPTDIFITTAAEEETLEADLANNDVILDTNATGVDEGNITITRDIDWTTENSLTLVADNDIFLSGALNGINGALIVSASSDVVADGAVNVNEFVLQSGNWTQVGPLAPFSANNFNVQGGEFLRATGGIGSDAEPFIIVDVYGLQGVGSSARMLSSNYMLGADIDAIITRGWSRADTGVTRGFVPIGNSDIPFSGTFDGDMNAINGLFVENTVGGFGTAALFAENGGAIRNLSLTNVDFNGGRAAGLVASNSGLIENVEVSGRVVGGAFAGGLVDTNSGTIDGSVSNADVFLDEGFGNYSGFLSIGGLVSTNSGTISNSQSLGDVVAQPTVGSNINLVVGGIAGRNSGNGTILDSSASGDIDVIFPGPQPTDGSSTIEVGDLAGRTDGGAIIGSDGTGLISVTNNSAAVVEINGVVVDPVIPDPTPEPMPVVDPVPIPDPVAVSIITLPNPPDTLGELNLSPTTAVSSGGEGAATGGAVADALEGQAQAQVAANGLVTVAAACAGGEDVETVLACLTDALDAFGTELDTILLQLPPELGDVARIIEDARDGVDAARRRAQARLATATTEAEREQIRNEALIEARASIDIAANRLRQRVALVRAQDPDLAAVQQATISVVATAVETVGVELARATDL
ncbi:filamentous hemagglutinin N-terminal domain-containing protein [Cognatiyoonia sp. IB215446]|uniref:two-partner secretion domain-containing protein n=1 Tax=Cognatiyoonia sp. IB215446 TaxID=3097355 RepID=UPI002A12505A|nr:filamentous hemagglutinin N-terminal domain-containing protein [Cognatiyoonia sp. IB215446]MDX8346617.1 filamentous hemagglutinin N-terminal domain-containing protein [Cognatiyoonia sp. IB215446]